MPELPTVDSPGSGDRIVPYDRVRCDSLVCDPSNVRKHPERNIEAIKASLLRFGQQKPIVVGKSGVVIAGNGTLMAARALGWDEIAVVRSTLDGSDATAFAIADNRTAELAEWDDEALASQLAALQIDDEALAEATGFDAKEIERLSFVAGEQDADAQIDRADELQKEWSTETGQLWALGDHRLLCGDSTKEDHVALVMGGTKADLCFTSPPYALGKSIVLRGNTRMAKAGRVYDQHEDDAESWGSLMRDWLDATAPCVHAYAINVQPLAGNKRELVRLIAEKADRLIDIITWNKGHGAPPMAQGVIGSAYEWLWLIGDIGASRAIPFSTWRGTVQSVYDGPPQRNNENADSHAATMPIHLPTWVIGTLFDSCRTVLEPFCGTGTTLIACENLKRRCFAIEISPAYVAVALQRFLDATGRRPELVA